MSRRESIRRCSKRRSPSATERSFTARWFAPAPSSVSARRCWTAPTSARRRSSARVLSSCRAPSVPPRTLWLGAPAREVRALSDAEVEDLTHFHRDYLVYKRSTFASRADGRGEIPRGQRDADLLPPESERFGATEAVAREVFGSYGYAEIRTPVRSRPTSSLGRSARRRSSFTRRCTRFRIERDVR